MHQKHTKFIFGNIVQKTKQVCNWGWWVLENKFSLSICCLTHSFMATKGGNVSITYFHSLEGLYKSIGSSKHEFKTSGAVSQTTPSLFMLLLCGILLQYEKFN